MKPDFVIARLAQRRARPIRDVAEELLGRAASRSVQAHGDYMAKLPLSLLPPRDAAAAGGRLVVVTGITPTSMGEGKTTVTVGLVDALRRLQRPSIGCIRQPSQGPIFGVKGGAAGGGHAQVLPMDEFNLHLTGDIHAVTAAHNLLAAAVDARMLHESKLRDATLFKRLTRGGTHFTPSMRARLAKQQGLPASAAAHAATEGLSEAQIREFVRLDVDPASLSWPRVLDVNDRLLRRVQTGLGEAEQGHGREVEFILSVASEVMAILGLASDLNDARARLGAIVVGASRSTGAAVTADDVGVGGAMTALMRDALKPTLLQTLEGSPVLVHAGPFANIAHGCSSVIADRMALRFMHEQGDGTVVTEAGFGADMGLEKFCHVKCGSSGLRPDAAVVVATVRALREVDSLADHVRICGEFGIPAVVALNRYPDDSDAEVRAALAAAREAGAADAVEVTCWQDGGAGAEALARALEATGPTAFAPLYQPADPLPDKLSAVARRVYGAADVQLTPKAQEELERIQGLGFGHLPVCIAKTPYSLSHDGSPPGFTLPVQQLRLCAGAGFVTAVAQGMSLMPGLPTRPNFHDIEVDSETGEVVGLM